MADVDNSKGGMSTGLKVVLGCLLFTVGGGLLVGGACVFLTMRAGARLGQEQRDEIASLDGKPAARVTAQQLIGEYTTNEIEADGRYKGKVVEVTGAISSIDAAALGTGGFVLLKGEAGQTNVVQCQLANVGDGVGLRPGQTVTLKGIGRGKSLASIGLRPCKVSTR